jgi:hypothetical protein
VSAFDADGHINHRVEIFVDGGWVDVTSRVRESDGITITRGRSNGQSTLGPSTLALTLDNRDGYMSPRNPSSPYYGLIGRNTPIRVTIGSDQRFEGEVSSWPQRWDTSGSDVYVPLEAAGIKRRLGQGQRGKRSALERSIVARSPVAYWPLDDGTSTSVGGSVVSGQPGVTAYGSFAFSKITGPDGARSTLPEFVYAVTAIEPVMTAFLSGSTGDSWTLDLIFLGDTTDIAVAQYAPIKWTTEWATWTLVIDFEDGVTDTITVTGTEADSGGGSVSVVISGEEPLDGEWHHLRVTLDQVGANATMEVLLDDVSGGTDTDAFVPGSVVQISVQNVPDTSMKSASCGHIAVYADTVATSTYEAMGGYWGELAAARMIRLCAEDGVHLQLDGAASATAAMGRQEESTLIDLMDDCADTDGGILYEPRLGLGLAYRTRDSMYNTTGPTWDYSANALSGRLEPEDDDDAIANDITVTRIDGGSWRSTQTSGPLNINDPRTDPDGVGVYDSTPRLYLDDDSQLPDVTGWLRHLGTWDATRYPRAEIGLHRSVWRADPVATAAAIALDIGSVVTLTNPPSWMPPDDTGLMIQGYTERIGAYTWTISYNATPAGAWTHVGVYDSSALGRYESDGSTLTTAITSADVSLSVTFTGPRWVLATDDAASLPFDIIIGGERMTVTDVADTTSPQTFTVTRSVNGVVKAHAAGAPIQLFHQARYAR